MGTAIEIKVEAEIKTQNIQERIVINYEKVSNKLIETSYQSVWERWITFSSRQKNNQSP